MHTIKKIVFLLFFIFLNACVAKQELLVPTQEDQEKRWQLFLENKIEEKPYALQGSIRFGSSENTNRVNYILWSNGTLPLRLDIMAGVGASIAKIAETQKEITMYFPQENRAIIMDNFGEINPLISMGMPVPISFNEISFLLRGGFNQIFENISLDLVKAKKAKKEYQRYTYYFSSKKMDGLMQLDVTGKPVYCEVNDEWIFEIFYDKKEQTPYKVIIRSKIEDYKAILMVKDRTFPVKYSKSDLKFTLPAQTEICNNY